MKQDEINQLIRIYTEQCQLKTTHVIERNMMDNQLIACSRKNQVKIGKSFGRAEKKTVLDGASLIIY